MASHTAWQSRSAWNGMPHGVPHTARCRAAAACRTEAVGPKASVLNATSLAGAHARGAELYNSRRGTRSRLRRNEWMRLHRRNALHCLRVASVATNVCTFKRECVRAHARAHLCVQTLAGMHPRASVRACVLAGAGERAFGLCRRRTSDGSAPPHSAPLKVAVHV